MTNLNIVYGYCENAQKAQIFEHLVQTTSIIKVKTIGNIADKAVFAALNAAYSTLFFSFPAIEGIQWVRYAVPDKKTRTKQNKVKSEKTETLSKLRLKRACRKQRNLTLTEKNWRQHINKKGALHEARIGMNVPYKPVLSPPR